MDMSSDLAVVLSFVNEAILFYGRGHQFFNCSDGALINGAKPTRADKVSVKERPGGKKELLKKIRNGFSTVTEEWFERSWNETKLRDGINTFADKASELFSEPTAFECKTYLAKFMALTTRLSSLEPRSDSGIENAVASMFRGTLNSMLISIKCHVERLSEPAMLLPFQEVVHREFMATIELLRADALAIIDDPSKTLPPLTKEVWDSGGAFIPELGITWKDVPRNTPCPCGSGKRYKHCHGMLT